MSTIREERSSAVRETRMALATEAAALLPCPFCGQQDLQLLEGTIGGSYAVVICRKCYAAGPEGESPAEARDLWNTRWRASGVN